MIEVLIETSTSWETSIILFLVLSTLFHCCKKIKFQFEKRHLLRYTSYSCTCSMPTWCLYINAARSQIHLILGWNQQRRLLVKVSALQQASQWLNGILSGHQSMKKIYTRLPQTQVASCQTSVRPQSRTSTQNFHFLNSSYTKTIEGIWQISTILQHFDSYLIWESVTRLNSLGDSDRSHHICWIHIWRAKLFAAQAGLARTPLLTY